MEAQENSQTEQNAQAPKKRELALVSRSTYIKEKALQWIFFACAFLAVVTVILIFVFTTYSALPVFTDIGLADFFSFTWAPSEGHYGILSLLIFPILLRFFTDTFRHFEMASTRRYWRIITLLPVLLAIESLYLSLLNSQEQVFALLLPRFMLRSAYDPAAAPGDLDHLAVHDESAWVAERDEFLLY